MARASNLTDAQKAQLYVLHCATCVYSGKKLWIIDGGASPDFTIDWADHIHPVAKGGPSTLDNGVCASWDINKKKNDKTEVPDFLFFEGKPTPKYYEVNTALPDTIVND
jgi:CRISPR/Cas system Type II protein with McrA/HNH and RuvC-like nuclease domain